MTSEAVRGQKLRKTEQNNTTSKLKSPNCFRLCGSVVKVLDCEARGPGFDPHLNQKIFYIFHMDTREINVIKDYRPISHGPFFRRRSIGPLPSCLVVHGYFE